MPGNTCNISVQYYRRKTWIVFQVGFLLSQYPLTAQQHLCELTGSSCRRPPGYSDPGSEHSVYGTAAWPGPGTAGDLFLTDRGKRQQVVVRTDMR